MGNVQANGRAAGECSCLRVFSREKTDVEESVELQSISAAESSDEGNTDLHNAVMLVCKSDEANCSHDYNDIDQLMSCATNLNKPNKKGYTAIGIAVEFPHRKTVKHMLKQDKDGRLYLDYYPGDSESTLREIIMQTFPDLQPLQKPPVMEKMNSSERNIKLLAALQHDEYKIFEENIPDFPNPNPWYNEPYYSSLLEIACHMKNRKEFVKLLLDKGADPDIKNRVTDMPLLHATARSGNLDVLKVLLKHPNVDKSVTDNKNRTILHWLASVSGKKPGDKERLDSCFKLVLNSCENKIIDWEDNEGNTALYIAVKSEFQDRVLLLLKRGADITLSIHGTPILTSVSTPMLEAILDDCLECNDEPETNEDLKLTFSYEIINKIMPHMAECPHQRELLKHPVTSCFINLHYEYIMVPFFLRLFTHSAMLLIFTSVILFDVSLHFGLRIVPAVIIAAFGISDLIILIYFRTADYLWIMEILPFLPAFFYACGLDFDVLTSSRVWPHVTVIALLCPWLKLLWMTWRLPWVAVKMEMFRRVSVTFFKYMATYSILIIIFTLTICTVAKESQNLASVGFSELFSSMLRTIFLSTGAVEFSSIPFVTLSSTSYMIYLLFVFLMVTILLNLLNGLAVFDTQEIIRDAETVSFVVKVKLLKVNNIHRISQKLFGPNKMKEGKLSLYPNRWKAPFLRLLVRSNVLSSVSHCIRIKRQPRKKPQSPEEKLAAMEKKLTEMQETLNNIVTRLDNRE